MIENSELKVLWVCEKAQMTPQNYYARRSVWSRQEVDVGLVVELVRVQRREQPRLGVRKLYHLIQHELRQAGVKIGRDRLFEELGKAGLLVERKASEWPKTTHFDENLPVFRNLSKLLDVTTCNMLWAADITYIRTEEKFMYLALITDRYSRKIVGYHLSESLETEGAMMALGDLGSTERPMHHSDRGCQYASHAYVKRVESAGLTMSMTEENHSAENAFAERVNGTLKQEFNLDATFRTKEEARRATAQAVALYNNRRPHTALGYRTPQSVHEEGA